MNANTICLQYKIVLNIARNNTERERVSYAHLIQIISTGRSNVSSFVKDKLKGSYCTITQELLLTAAV